MRPNQIPIFLRKVVAAVVSGTPAVQRGTTTNIAGVQPQSIAKPTGVVAGDILYLRVVGGGTPTLPSGWTSIGTGTTPFGELFLHCWLLAGGSEPSTYTLAASSGALVGELSAYSGADTVTPFEGYSASNMTSVTTYTAPSATATQNNGILLTTYFTDQSGSATVAVAPSPVSSSLGIVGNGSIGTLTDYARQVNIGASGTTTMDWSLNSWGYAASIILRTATP